MRQFPWETLDSVTLIRHQMFELPKIEPVKAEYVLQGFGCSCGHKNWASLPKHMVGTHFGPNLHAAIAYLDRQLTGAPVAERRR